MSVLTTNYLTPTGREEAWRFTPLKRLGGLHDGSATTVDRKSLSFHGVAPAGVTFSRISRELLAAQSPSDDVIVQRIHAESSDVALLEIAANTEIAEPVFLNRRSGGLEGAELSRVQIRVGANSRATVIVENSGAAILGEDVEITLEPGSHLKFVTLQEWSEGSVHAARHHAMIDRDATFQSITVTIGGSLVRLLPTVEFLAPGASAELLGVYFATAGQFFEHRIHVDHGVPRQNRELITKAP